MSTSQNPPRVTILMPVFNAERYLSPAIESMLNQTFQDFELLLLNDGSTDRSTEIMAAYAQQDPRVIVHDNPVNQGLVKNLVFGVNQARGDYIARMDSDDISLPQRLEKQVAYLDAHPEVGLLGTNVQYIDENGAFLEQGRPRHAVPESEVVLRWMLRWKCVIYHPTVMLRRSVLQEHNLNYNEDYTHAEDWEFWSQILRHAQVYRLHEVLLHYRVLPSSLSHQTWYKQWIRRNIERELLAFTQGEAATQAGFATLLDVFSRVDQPSERAYRAANRFMFDLYAQYAAQGLSSTDRQMIEADVINRSRTLALYALRSSKIDALRILLAALQLNPGVFLTMLGHRIALRVSSVFRR